MNANAMSPMRPAGAGAGAGAAVVAPAPAPAGCKAAPLLLAAALFGGAGLHCAADEAFAAGGPQAPNVPAAAPALATASAQSSEPRPAPVLTSEEEKRAKALLERAVEHVRKHGEAGAAHFSRQSAFVDRDLYAYALRTDGVFLSSGGDSVALVGENVRSLTDAEGKPFMREILELAEAQGEGRVEYQWYNAANVRGEPKLTMFRKVGEVIVAVGFYPPRATPADARALLERAEQAFRADEGKALADFQAYPGHFIRDDLYVFVIDLESGKFLANGANPALVGTNARELRDANGRPIIDDSMEIAARDGEGRLVYSWRNPVTKRIESKHTWFRTVHGKLLGVGYFTR